MIMKSLKIYVAVAFSIAITGCNFLDVVPPETADIPDMIRDRNDAISFVYSCYASIQNAAAPNNLGAIESSTDEFANPQLWGRMSQQVAWNQISPTYKSNWSPMYFPWDMTYTSIGKCHLFVKLIDELNPTGVSEEDKKLWKSEIKFCLAYHHFRLLALYGPIPIIERLYPTDLDKNDMPGRYHYDYCVEKIVNWLNEAEAGLPDVWDNPNLCRATVTICKALKARVLLYAASPLWNGSFPNRDFKNTKFETPGYGYDLVSWKYDEQKWVRARQACQEALEYATTKGQRRLFSVADSEALRTAAGLRLPWVPGNVGDDFKKKVMMFNYLMSASELEGNKEVIWGIFLEGWTNNINEALPHAIVTRNDGLPFGGASAMAPLLYAIEHFYTENGELPKYDEKFYPESEWFESAGYEDRKQIIKLHADREPRFYAWMGFDGHECGQLLADGAPCILEMRNSQKHGYNPEKFNMDNSATGYVNKKWTAPGLRFSKVGGSNRRFIPMSFIRLPELYLSLAECEAMLGHEQEALNALNIIRKRAGVKELVTGDLTAEMPLMEWIRNERYIELYGEGHRYHDLRRWCLAPEYLKAGVRYGLNAVEKLDPSFEEFNKRTLVDQPFEWDDRMYILPIEADEVYSNPQLVQAPGY